MTYREMLTDFVERARKAFVAASMVFVTTFVAQLTGQDVSFGADPSVMDIVTGVLQQAVLPTVGAILTGGLTWLVPNKPGGLF